MLRFLKTNVEKVVWEQFAGPAATCRVHGKARLSKVILSHWLRSPAPTNLCFLASLMNSQAGLTECGTSSPDSHPLATVPSSSSHLLFGLTRLTCGWDGEMGEDATSSFLIFHLVPNCQLLPPSAASRPSARKQDETERSPSYSARIVPISFGCPIAMCSIQSGLHISWVILRVFQSACTPDESVPNCRCGHHHLTP